MQMNRVNRIVLSAIVLLAMNVKGGETTAKSRSSSARRFTLEEAVLTALQQNPTILIARQEIERTKGLFIEMRAAALPQVNATATFQDLDPHLGHVSGGNQNSISGQVFGTVGAERTYTLEIAANQVMFSGGRVPGQISSASFQRDSSYYSFRNVIDLIVATVREQFYLVLLDRALIGVQEESVRLLQSQLQDQQNRFEAGTVPRFNVLQAQVALSNQIPLLIAAQNNYRISKLILAKTLGLDFDPLRGENPPLEVVGEMPNNQRTIALVDAIELGKKRRPFLKQARANVLNQVEQVHVALGGFLPTINGTGGGEWVSSPINPGFFDNISKGWLAQATGSWPIWDSGAVY